ncbi:Cathelicidin antimicrobial peptide [Aix galericulata]|nr:Cathelicidin antimicrobial peptide [Aix galericulata]
MASCWVLLLLGLGGACALPAPAPLAYSQALAQAVDSFNQRPEVQNAFRLLSADPEPAPVSSQRGDGEGTARGHQGDTLGTLGACPGDTRGDIFGAIMGTTWVYQGG